MSLGDHREDILLEDKDRQRFLYMLGKPVSGPYGRGEGDPGPSPVPGDHYEPEMDRAAATNGQLDLRFQPASKIALARISG
jgi:hypothetical protein